MSEIRNTNGGTPQMKAVAIVCGALAFAAGSVMSSGFGGYAPDAFANPITPLPFAPAGYAFSIWGVIFIALILNAFYGLIKRDTNAEWDATRWPLFVTQVIGAAWIGIAQVSPMIATVLIWVMLAGALLALRSAMKTRDVWWLQVPLGLLAGWLTAACWVATTTTLVGSFAAISPVVGSWIGLVGALVTALALLRALPQPALGAAVVWALIGVIVTDLSGPMAFLVATILGTALVAIMTLATLRRA